MKNRILTSIVFLTIIYIHTPVLGQNTFIVYLKDKDLSIDLNETFSDRSMQRRIKNNVRFDHFDYPVNRDYVDQLNDDCSILNTSRWLNAISLETHLTSAVLLAKYSFIKGIKKIEKNKSEVNKWISTSNKNADYGVGFAQIEQINLACLHEDDKTGSDIYVAILDAGFNEMNNMTSFDSLKLSNRILDVHDFVHNDDFVYDYSDHGTMVSSCIVAQKSEGMKFIGTAKSVDIALYVTEDVTSETELEEFNLVAGLERCDVQGVDIANISLGYFDLDNPTETHVFSDLDGETTVASIGVNVAFSKGILVVVAAGNSGPSHISTPCDAKDGLCVGAVKPNSDYANFSSVGPTADNRIKPDVAARGESSVVIDITDNPTLADGTSFATPITTGGLACLMESNPSSTVEEVIQVIRQSASQSTTPDNLLGYGLVNFCEADQLLKSAAMDDLNSAQFKLFPNPATNSFNVELAQSSSQNYRIVNNIGMIISSGTIANGSSSVNCSEFSNGMYIFEVELDGVLFRSSLIVAN